jgi:hypothetical protein
MPFENEAVNAYLNFLRTKDVTQKSLDARIEFLMRLIAGLAAKPYYRVAYAGALNMIMKKTRDLAWHFHMQVAREFYPFWMQDIKAIALLSEQFGAQNAMVEWTPLPTSLKQLSSTLETITFDEIESVQLEQYLSAMRQQGLSKGLIVVKLRLAKIMLLRLRDAPQKSGAIYRVAVDMTLPLFRLKNSRQLFLTVVREFFQHWITDKSGDTRQLLSA